MKNCHHAMFSPESSCQHCNDWALKKIKKWKQAALSNGIIYKFGLVFSPNLVDHKKIDETEGSVPNDDENSSIWSLLLLLLLTITSLVIQTVIPIAIVATLPLPHGEICPDKANALTKFIGLALCLFFVVLTISLCLNKLGGMMFLKLFCIDDNAVKTLGLYRFFIDAGILSNMVSMGAAGVAQYILFVRNAEKDYLSLLLQSLAMQFVLTVDEKLMVAGSSWGSWTKQRLELLMKYHDMNESSHEIGDEIVIDKILLGKVRLLYTAESVFLATVAIVGVVWSISLAYCM